MERVKHLEKKLANKRDQIRKLERERDALRAALQEIADKRTHAGVWVVGEQDTTSFLRMTQCYDIAAKALTQQEPDDE